MVGVAVDRKVGVGVDAVAVALRQPHRSCRVGPHGGAGAETAVGDPPQASIDESVRDALAVMVGVDSKAAKFDERASVARVRDALVAHVRPLGAAFDGFNEAVPDDGVALPCEPDAERSFLPVAQHMPQFLWRPVGREAGGALGSQRHVNAVVVLGGADFANLDAGHGEVIGRRRVLLTSARGWGAGDDGGVIQVRTFDGHEMPCVEVCVEGVWYSGDLRAWRQHDDHSWTAQVAWTRSPGETLMGVFAASDVRKVDEEQWLRDYFARRAAEGSPVPEGLTGGLGPSVSG